jgi:PIN domain nuclease of toxin-antitoxin system
MRLLLDTHIFCWWFYEPERLSGGTLKLIRGAERVFVSSASIWEVAIKARLGKIDADPRELYEQI